MATPTKLFTLCYLLMASLFAYSASVQLNDPDWYFWFPVYAGACVVNLVNWSSSSNTKVGFIAKVTLWLGIFLFIKVVVEDFVTGIAGFWSLDLTERVVREKIGSGLVIISMILNLEASSLVKHLNQRKRKEIESYVAYGMLVLVAFSYGLPFVFFVVRKGEIKF